MSKVTAFQLRGANSLKSLETVDHENKSVAIHEGKETEYQSKEATPQKELNAPVDHAEQPLNISQHLALEKIHQIFKTLDSTDIRILIKFYLTGKPFPSDVNPFVFQMLFDKLTKEGLDIKSEALRKRMSVLVGKNLIMHDRRMMTYNPIRNPETVEILRAKIRTKLTNWGFNKVFNLKYSR